jgi:hypothetical protein
MLCLVANATRGFLRAALLRARLLHAAGKADALSSGSYRGKGVRVIPDMRR